MDGVNGKSLYVGDFYCAGYASSADPDPEKVSRSLAPEDYGRWLLANFASVEMVKAHCDHAILVPNPIAELVGESFPGHFTVYDCTGVSAVIEPVDSMLKILDNPLGVFTNSPIFNWHNTNLRNYSNLTATNASPIEVSGIKLSQFGQGTRLKGIPGDFTPPSRFVGAVTCSRSAIKLPTAEETVPQVFHIMNAFDITVGAIRDVHGNEVHHDCRLWTSASDMKNIRWVCRTYNDQSIQRADVRTALHAADRHVKLIEMDSAQPIEDVSINFKLLYIVRGFKAEHNENGLCSKSGSY